MNDSIEYKGLTIEIEQDQDPESPRSWDNLGTMVLFHKRYNLGDKAEGATGHGFKSQDYSSWAELQEAIEARHKPVVILPLYLYDHSGLRIKVGSFQGHLPQGHAEFDSGQIGFIFVSREAALKEYGGKKLTAKKLAQAQKVLEGEVETYDQYLRGDVYGYTVKDAAGEHLDSCWGFYGYDYCLQEAKSVAEHHAAKAATTVASIGNQGDGI
jgi:hypothetical protein